MAEDEVLESWEDLEDSGELDRRLDNIKVKSVSLLKKNQNSVDNSAPLLVEDTQRTVFTPQVKILKRNTNVEQGKTNAHISSSSNMNKGYKSLEEREAAYAEARQRIFGASQSTDESSAMGDYIDSAVAKQLGTMRVNEASNITRQPYGPDGTKGFGGSRQVVER